MSDPPPDPHHPRAQPPGNAGESRSGALTDREAAEFTRLIGGMASAGLALPVGLRALAEESGSHRVRVGMLRVADRIEQGRSLASAIADEGRSLPEHLVGVARAAERSGRLAEVLGEASRFERIGADLSRQLLLRLAYPALLLCGFALLFQVLGHLIMVDLATINEDFGMTMPALSRGLVAISQFITGSPWLVPSAIALVALLTWQAARGGSRGLRRRVVSGVPLFGTLWRNAALSEFSSLLALMIECRLPLPEALVLAGRGARDPDLISACLGAAQEVEAGRTLADASRSYRLFPPGVDRLLAWAEDREVLPDTLRLAAETFEARARSQAALIGLFVSASVSAFVLLGVILTFLGLYLPMLNLLTGLSGGTFALW